jgi:hypothetical protein
MWELKLRLFTNTDKRNPAPKRRSPSDSGAMDAQDLDQVRNRDGSNTQAASSGSSSLLDAGNSQSQSTSYPDSDIPQKTAKELEDEADEVKYGKVSHSW